jgi:DNA topoisomerase-1
MCEKCGEKMVVKLGRFGKFLSCSNYPKCKNARPLEKNMGAAVLSGSVSVSEEKLEELVEEGKLTEEQAKQVEEKNEKVAEYEKEYKDKKCEKCGEPMAVKHGRFGAFLGCSAYPKCKNIVSIVISSGVKCPVCKAGQLIERHTKKGGRVFWGCNKYPKCKFATWSKPIELQKDGTLIVEDKEGNHVPYVDTKEEKGEN